MSRALTAPVSTRIRSARVDFPWSIWAATTMFLIELGSVMSAPGLVHPTGARTVRWATNPLLESRAYGQYQVPEEAHPHEREGAPAQSGDGFRPEDAGSQVPRGAGVGRPRSGRDCVAVSLSCLRQGGCPGRDPQEQRGEPQVAPAP